MNNHNSPDIRIERRPQGGMAVCFTAMASPCEILLGSEDARLGNLLGRLGAAEALRIERKFSRYREDSTLSRLNRSGGKPVAVDRETAALLDFAAQCYTMSEGKFDVTSGILRRAWHFDGSDRLPARHEVEALLGLIGFDKLCWNGRELVVPAGMEIDLGGIAKEYAVDQVLHCLSSREDVAVLVNFGGDLCTNRAPHGGPWQIGVERPDTDRQAAMLIELSFGALATSGDTRRYLRRDGVRYSHILDPATGWPVPDAPRSVTVASGSCVEAGMLATFALLQGRGAAAFLAQQGVLHWCLM